MNLSSPPVLKKIIPILLILLWLSALFQPAQAHPSATFNIAVDMLDDDPAASACTTNADDCSLRGAIAFANNVTAGSTVTITIPAGTYVLTAAGADEDANETGDLDITRYNTITLSGAGTGSTILDGNHTDRVIDNRTGILTLEHLTVQSGSVAAGSGGGGGIVNRGGRSLTITGVHIQNNSVAGTNKSTDIGGGIANYGDLYATVSNFVNNEACGGGGLAVSTGSLLLDRCYISGNQARSEESCGDGGGITSLNPSLDLFEISFTQIDGNSGVRGGGMFINYDDAVITDSSFDGNTASTNGGGLYNYGAITLERVALTHNQASGFGGGIANSEELTLWNVTLSGNGASSGGGLYNTGGSTMSLDHCTVAGNTATIAGTAYYGWTGSETTLHNNILAGTVPGNTWVNAGIAAIINLGYNLCSDTSCPLSTDDHDLVNIDPQLKPLGYYGGANLTMPLLPISPAIDTADPVITLISDQRGFPRADGNRDGSILADIGAFEYSPVIWFPQVLNFP
jgi:hypothetical protein